jgi:two-component system sensor histidine kinase VanS
VDRAPGLSVRLKLTLSYVGFLMLTGALLLAAAWLAGQRGQSFEFLLRYVPDGVISTLGGLVLTYGSSWVVRSWLVAGALARR